MLLENRQRSKVIKRVGSQTALPLPCIVLPWKRGERVMDCCLL